jgi:toxin ParE1/3/4
MKLVWLARARSARTAAIEYIAADSPRAALAQLDQIERQTDMLLLHPELGRPGRIKATRELVISHTPFIVIYRIRPRAKCIELLNLVHSSRQWPPVKG